jgi:hypothetical protein
MCWTVDFEGGAPTAIHWHAETRRIHGVSDDFKPNLTSAIEFYAPEARAMITEAFQKCVTDHAPSDLELLFITAAGLSKTSAVVVDLEGSLTELADLVEDQVDFEGLVDRPVEFS